jgi:hypothetical protein
MIIDDDTRASTGPAERGTGPEGTLRRAARVQPHEARWLIAGDGGDNG